MISKSLHVFTLIFAAAIPNLLAASWKDDYVNWVMDRHDWKPEVRKFIQQNPQDADSLILQRYLELFINNLSTDSMPSSFNQLKAEQAVEYCPCGVADLHYVLTGIQLEGPCILIALTESLWLEHLTQIQKRIQDKISNHI